MHVTYAKSEWRKTFWEGGVGAGPRDDSGSREEGALLRAFRLLEYIKEKNKPKNIKEQNPTGFCAWFWIHPADRPINCLQKNGSSDPTQYLSFSYCLDAVWDLRERVLLLLKAYVFVHEAFLVTMFLAETQPGRVWQIEHYRLFHSTFRRVG